ncbi:hypothetical protein Ppa06_35670 [Planomonospora parontospora subsp. parontospora]|uniref:DUF2975 domain-containing protein n=2 Tax=Planomonospora parontospora TaxID=58119 RepID=A0AA37BH59_9ACTN|nr:DUF2975 domain-containing protein [Planomonospora parontospora]GGK70767.1 hypothetical protein GCM10010126_32790 [Planomonospora parontospora]GII09769.1 hypothetical protein Ppa06_35670 [Planomonospora parontospora subsp. parontospora]
MAKPPASIRTLEGITWAGAGLALLGIAFCLYQIFDGSDVGTRHVIVNPYLTATGADDPAPVPTGPPGTVRLVTSSFDRTLAVIDPDLSQRFLLLLPELLLTIMLGAVAVVLLQLIRTFREGDPFIPANARRLAVIGVLLLGIAFLPRVEVLSLNMLLSGTPLENVGIQNSEDFYWALFVGFTVLALAEVFRQGSRLRSDTQGLV